MTQFFYRNGAPVPADTKITLKKKRQRPERSLNTLLVLAAAEKAGIMFGIIRVTLVIAAAAKLEFFPGAVMLILLAREKFLFTPKKNSIS